MTPDPRCGSLPAEGSSRAKPSAKPRHASSPKRREWSSLPQSWASLSPPAEASGLFAASVCTRWTPSSRCARIGLSHRLRDGSLWSTNSTRRGDGGRSKSSTPRTSRAAGPLGRCRPVDHAGHDRPVAHRIALGQLRHDRDRPVDGHDERLIPLVAPGDVFGLRGERAALRPAPPCGSEGGGARTGARADPGNRYVLR